MAEYSPTQSDHDGYYLGSTRNTSAAFIICGSDDPNVTQAWILFPSVAIDQGANIGTAKLSLRAYSTPVSGTLADVRTIIRADDADNPSVPSSASDAAGRTRTTAGVDWDPSVWAANTDYDSPDISAVIQEIVDRPGWTSGNNLLILWDDDGSTAGDHRVNAYSWDDATAPAPKLTVEVGGGAFVGWGIPMGIG